MYLQDVRILEVTLSIKKVQELRSKLAEAEENAAKDIATMAMQSGVIEVGERELKKFFTALGKSTDTQRAAALEALST